MSLEIKDLITQSTQIIVAGTALYGLVYAIRQYKLTRNRFLEDSRPYILVELERVTSGLFDLVIRNAGKSAAKNIGVQFKPNIKLHDYSKQKINSYKFLKNLKFLAADKYFSFFFGSVIGGNTNICREFEIVISYEDLDGKKYTSEQVIDPRDYLEVTTITRRDIHDVAKSLDEIKKLLAKDVKASEGTVGLVSKGLTSRDSIISKLDSKQMLILLLNLINEGIDSEYGTYPFAGDIRLVAKLARDQLLTKQRLTNVDKQLLSSLTRFQKTEYEYKKAEVLGEAVNVIKKYLEK